MKAIHVNTLLWNPGKQTQNTQTDKQTKGLLYPLATGTASCNKVTTIPAGRIYDILTTHRNKMTLVN